MQLPNVMPSVMSSRSLRAHPDGRNGLRRRPPTLASSTRPMEGRRQPERLARALDGADQDLAQERRQHRGSDDDADAEREAPALVVRLRRRAADGGEFLRVGPDHVDQVQDVERNQQQREADVEALLRDDRGACGEQALVRCWAAPG